MKPYHKYGGPQLSRQNQFRYGKIIILTAKSISPRQNQFRHGKINFATAKSISSRQNQFHNTAKSVSSRQNHFHPTCSRDISSQSAMGVNPTWRSSSWFHNSTCIAPTVEIVCFQQHISACSVDKVSRKWLMDVFKYTQCIFQILMICSWLV